MRYVYRLVTRLALVWLFAAGCSHNPAAAQPARFDASAAEPSSRAPIDILHYDARVEPDIASQSVSGRVLIRFTSRVDKLAAIELDCGELTIDAVRQNEVELEHVRRGRRLAVTLERPMKRGVTQRIEITYHGTPRFGIRFFPEQAQVYTVFSTSQWLPCIDAPEDRATLRLALVLPAGLAAVANGRSIGRSTTPDDKAVHEWSQDAPVPTYTFGFAAGRFREVSGRVGRVRLRHLAVGFSDAEVERVFRDTADMIRFYEERTSVAYAGDTYTQVLAAGTIEQEMSGFTVMRETYGREVLADEEAIRLGAHELAHQWWGNMVTCRDWTHFWLNEGLATFMAAAYQEHRFGRRAYLREIERSCVRYERVRAAGKDKSLVFPDWTRPTREDRTLVYDKGAYVLHLLREEMGERAFWAGIRRYTRTHFGKSVVTPDFQRVMERAGGKSLVDFFAAHVYLTKR